MNKRQEVFYEIAALELAERRPVPGLMAKAFSDADGDERRSYAGYIKLRVFQLEEEDERLQEEEREQQRRQKQEEARKQEVSPERNKIIALSCPQCGHNEAQAMPRGEWGLFFILLCLFVVPGLIYAFLTSGYRYLCTKCGHEVKSTYI